MWLLIVVFSGHTSLSFAGNSYIKYRLSENSKEEDFKLGLRLRTLQSNGIIMYTRANPCIILKVIKMGYLFLQSVLMLVFWLVGWGLLKPFCLLHSGDQKQTVGQGEQQQNWEECQHPVSFCVFGFENGSWQTGDLSLEWVQGPASLEL